MTGAVEIQTHDTEEQVPAAPQARGPLRRFQEMRSEPAPEAPLSENIIEARIQKIEELEKYRLLGAQIAVADMVRFERRIALNPAYAEAAKDNMISWKHLSAEDKREHRRCAGRIEIAFSNVATSYNLKLHNENPKDMGDDRYDTAAFEKLRLDIFKTEAQKAMDGGSNQRLFIVESPAEPAPALPPTGPSESVVKSTLLSMKKTVGIETSNFIEAHMKLLEFNDYLLKKYKPEIKEGKASIPHDEMEEKDRDLSIQYQISDVLHHNRLVSAYRNAINLQNPDDLGDSAYVKAAIKKLHNMAVQTLHKEEFERFPDSIEETMARLKDDNAAEFLIRPERFEEWKQKKDGLLKEAPQKLRILEPYLKEPEQFKKMVEKQLERQAEKDQRRRFWEFRNSVQTEPPAEKAEKLLAAYTQYVEATKAGTPSEFNLVSAAVPEQKQKSAKL